MNKEQIQKAVIEVIQNDPSQEYIQSISLFGSFLHGNESPESDVDLLFDMRKTMTLFQIGGIQYRLQEKLGREVDFIERNSLDKYIKDEVLAEAEKIYEKR